MLYFISDLHFGESKIEEMFYVADFNNSVQFYETFVKLRWNQKINNEDTVIVVGDAGNPLHYSNLKGKKILIRGNHDDYYPNMYSTFDNVVENLELSVSGCRIGIRHIPERDTFDTIEICGHLHNISVYMNIYPTMTRLFVLPNLLGYEPRTIEELLSDKIQNWRFDFLALKEFM